MILVMTLILVTGSGEIGQTEQKEGADQEGLGITQTLRIMGKGTDHIVVGEKPLYILPRISKITDISGRTVSLASLRVPCLAEVSYARWMRGVKQLPVVLNLKVKKVYRGSSAVESREY
jgi:hypothetical protein